jgi:hypothetical protein
MASLYQAGMVEPTDFLPESRGQQNPIFHSLINMLGAHLPAEVAVHTTGHDLTAASAF